MMRPSSILTPVDRLQKQLSRHCFWDEVEQRLYVDARRLFPKVGVLCLIGWDQMMMDNQPIPDYPSFLKPMHWPKQGDFNEWHRQIPRWVLESCALFPSHQLTLLHYAGKYPQVLELLDHAPMLAWRLVTAGLKEPEVVALLAGKRSQIAASVGWPGKADTVKFLTNLRLRWVDQEIAEQVETCLLDEDRLAALQDLPRINSMALSLASRFPELIGSTLHRALAQLPCRPMQCKRMVALLSDAYRLAEFLALPPSEVERIGQCRFLVEVSHIYRQWMQLAVSAYAEIDADLSVFQAQLGPEPKRLTQVQEGLALVELTEYAWMTDFNLHQVAHHRHQLLAWKDEEGVWGALVDVTLPTSPTNAPTTEDAPTALIRGEENSLAGPKQLATLHLWQAQQLKQTD